jgi:hypothetical protein
VPAKFLNHWSDYGTVTLVHCINKV